MKKLFVPLILASASALAQWWPVCPSGMSGNNGHATAFWHRGPVGSWRLQDDLENLVCKFAVPGCVSV